MSHITSLLVNQVFIFGSNASGFHGAGAAGYACRGDSRNNWRDDVWFCNALKSPIGSPDRIGKWAIVGQARGLQTGKEGKSYAIITIAKPGFKRSTPVANITADIVEMFSIAEERSDLQFLFTEIGSALAGYTADQMARTLECAIEEYGYTPDNVIYPQYLYGRKKFDWDLFN